MQIKVLLGPTKSPNTNIKIKKKKKKKLNFKWNLNLIATYNYPVITLIITQIHLHEVKFSVCT